MSDVTEPQVRRREAAHQNQELPAVCVEALQKMIEAAGSKREAAHQNQELPAVCVEAFQKMIEAAGSKGCKVTGKMMLKGATHVVMCENDGTRKCLLDMNTTHQQPCLFGHRSAWSSQLQMPCIRM